MPPKKKKSVDLSCFLQNDSCDSCGNKIDVKPLVCDICDGTLHPQCAGLSNEIYEKFIVLRDVVGWVCQDCRKGASNKIDKLQTAHTVLADEICAIKLEITEQKNLTVSQAQPPPISYADVLKSSTVKVELHKEVRSVIKDTDRRARNIIITGLKPIGGTTDITLLERLFNQEFSLKLSSENFSCKRIGKDTNNSPRRILVSFSSTEVANSLIREAKNLRNSLDTYTASNIYINRDLSPEEAKVAFEKRAQRRAQSIPATHPQTSPPSAPLPNSTVSSSAPQVQPATGGAVNSTAVSASTTAPLICSAACK